MMLENKWYEADTVQDSVFLLTCKADQGKNLSGCVVFFRNNSQSLTPWLNIDYNIATRKELIV